jgi:cell fate regulator YaaT (PSP1 superfamily)
LNHLVGVKFKKEGKTYYFNSSGLSVKCDDLVLVETDNGTAIGTVMDEVGDPSVPVHSSSIKKILRLVTDEDLRIRSSNRTLEEESRAYCAKKIAERQLPMKLVDVECLFDRSKIVFSFASETRVDFRELVKDLVQKFKTRIELRQIGARQETKIIKGLGICGREVCCGSFLNNLDRVSVKMAKEQNMPLNQEKISGLCGRLMCCLAFEYETYLDLKKEMPRCGRMVQTAAGPGKVIRQNILKDEVVVMVEDKTEMTFKSCDVKRLT